MTTITDWIESLSSPTPEIDAVFHLIKSLGFQLQIAPAKNFVHLS
jgi:hypothetical protein